MEERMELFAQISIVNWWAILTATALAFVLGGLWYGPLFGAAWLDAIGKTEADLEPSATPFVVSFFAALLTAVVLALLLATLKISGWIDGSVLGLWVGIGFIAAAMASDASFCRWGLKLFLIQSGYRVVYSVVMGGILGYWQ
jgi:hypothetical protein